jgi:tight adherence protein B
MARTSGGTYSEVFNSKGLERVYDALGARLANEYYASYRSLAKADTRVRVAVRLPGHPVFTSSYAAPPLSVAMTPVEPSRFDEVLTSWPFALLLVAVIVGLLAYAVRSVLAVRRASLRERMAQFIEMPGEDTSLLSREELSARLRDFEDSIERTGFAERFAERCDIGFVTTKPSTLLLGSFAASASLSLMLSVTWSPWWIVLMPVGPIAVWLYVDDRVRAQRSLFQEQLPDNLEVLAAALRVGHSLAGGLQHMAEDTAEPSKREFRRVVTDEQLGVALEDALLKVATRMESRDMEHVSLVARLQRETGGASAEVIDQVTANIRGRMEVRRLVRTLTAQGRLARWIVSLMPLAVIALILIVYPAYLEPLFEKTVGLLALLIAGIMVVLGSYVIKRIVEIHV